MKSGIIYIATCKNNGKSYIGQTIQTINIRKRKHINDSKKESTKFYYAVRKYGFNSFKWRILYNGIPYKLLDIAEICAIYTYNTYDKGYNSTLGGGATLGHKHTAQTKKKMSEAKIGKKLKPFTKEHCKKISEAKVGKKHTESAKRKMSMSQVGNTNRIDKRHTQKSKDKMSESHKGLSAGKNNPMYGKHHTNITKNKIRNALKGKKLSEHRKIKIASSLSKNIYKVVKPNGSTEIIKNLAKYCRENGLNSSGMYEVVKGKYTHHRGYKCEKIK